MSKAAFAEVQKRLVDTQKQYRQLMGQKQAQHREALSQNLTLKELEKVGDETPVYKAVGRMFMQTPKAEIVESYTAQIKKAEERLLVMGNTQNYLERQMEECQKQLTELAVANPTGEDVDAANADGGD